MPDQACSAQQLLSAGIRTTNSRQLYPTLHQPADAGLPMLVIENALGKTVVALQGAHVMSFQPAGQPEMLWISPKTLLLDGTPIRGGIPVCFPWFGKGPSGDLEPAHGFGHGPAHARVHFVEDQRRRFAQLAGGDSNGQRDARQLTARGDLL